MASKSPPRDMNKVKQRVTKKIKAASKQPRNQNFCFYGEPGSGKTRLAATAPDVLIIDVNDLGTDSVRRDIDPMVYSVERWQEINDLYWFLQEGDHAFKSVAIDTLTNLQNLCMSWVLGDEASRDASRDPDMPARQAWGKVGQLMRTQITNFRNLPLNVIFNCQVRERAIGDDEDDEQIIVLGPEVSPSVQKTLTAAVGTIGYITKREVYIKKKGEKKKRKEVRKRLLVGDSPKYITKDRNGVFGEYIDAPDLTEMLKLIYEK